ncbi:BNR/Asp-box repeat protein [Gimesia panareensis]|uniref:exo-alpha-sialidase n=1 Tax=Gimesia panareensis TaxID=2527978 RepID=A0A518ACX5_9PLAN|nr:BNR/Asp-box repeat protein [Gimesia panareensis]QDU52578.1 BNR/Asp-box repeat protein [Gimesia panareensis]
MKILSYFPALIPTERSCPVDASSAAESNQKLPRRQLLKQAAATAAAPLLLGNGAADAANTPVSSQGLQGCQMLPGARFYVAIDNKGLWPNLTKLPNGELAAVVYNHPSHGYGDNSDIELWISQDAGISWKFRSKVSAHPEEPDAIRMNHSTGLNADGHLVTLVSGYHKGQKRPYLKLQRCISTDQGKTWDRHDMDIALVPHGDIFSLPDGTLVSPVYKRLSVKPKRSCSAVIFSRDGGKTWGEEQALAEDVNETFVLRRRNGEWLAVCRTDCRDMMDRAIPHGSGEIFIRSTDAGKTWSDPRLMAPQGQENAHLLELADGRLLCSITSRIPGLFGVVMRISENGGEKWSIPVVLLSSPARDWHKTDSGYPSSVQLDDGSIVTAYYFGPKQPEYAAHALPWHQRYHMGIAKWDLSMWPED